VGNHDYINCSQFLTGNHWLNCVKHLPNLTVVDTLVEERINNFNFVFLPFTPDGRFIEALDTGKTTRHVRVETSDCIFGHQL
jgi:hypothetical protein